MPLEAKVTIALVDPDRSVATALIWELVQILLTVPVFDKDFLEFVSLTSSFTSGLLPGCVW
jgi:hypothetical protein